MEILFAIEKIVLQYTSECRYLFELWSHTYVCLYDACLFVLSTLKTINTLWSRIGVHLFVYPQ